MFTKHNIALVVACATLSTACDDYLDMPSYTTTDTETVFSTESAAEAYVLGCYRGLVTTDALYQLAAGDMITHSCEDGTTNNSKYNICNYYYDATTPYTLSSIYSEGYKTIEGVNVGLKGVGKLPESDKSKSLRAELLCQRAFAYWQLINVYGDVPAVWQSLEDMDMSDENTLYPTRASRDEIYDQIVSDLQWAAENLQWFEESGLTTTERLCKNSALALLAKVAMHAAGYSLRWDLKTNDPATLGVRRRSDEARVDELYAIARDACRQIIEHGGNELIQNQGTMSGFHYLWYNFCQRNLTSLNREIMWSLAELGSLTNSKFGLYAHPGSSGGTFGSRKSLQCLLPTYYLSFDSADTRRDVTCATYSIYPMDDVRYADEATTYSCVMAGKFRLHWCVEPQEASKRNLNIPLIRYSDVLLMFAEADNYLNGAPTADAQKALRQVRERAGIGDKEIPTTKEDFDDAVLQERYWEFGSELFNRFEILSEKYTFTQKLIQVSDTLPRVMLCVLYADSLTDSTWVDIVSEKKVSQKEVSITIDLRDSVDLIGATAILLRTDSLDKVRGTLSNVSLSHVPYYPSDSVKLEIERPQLFRY